MNAEVIDLPTERACADDRAYFEASPRRRYRLRPAVAGEFQQVGQMFTHVLVEQIGPGLRARRPFNWAGHIPTDLPDSQLEKLAAGLLMRDAR